MSSLMEMEEPEVQRGCPGSHHTLAHTCVHVHTHSWLVAELKFTLPDILPTPITDCNCLSCAGWKFSE